jgi:hypothetical protein
MGGDRSDRVPRLGALLGRRHLDGILHQDVSHFNQQRPHRAIDLEVPVASSGIAAAPRVRRHDVLGGLIHEYHSHSVAA